MTFVQLQNAVMGRLNLSTTDARTRIKVFLNQRYRALATSIGLGSVRFTSSTFATAAGTYTYSPTGLIKPLTLTIPASNIILTEKTMDEIRLLDPDLGASGVPYHYVVQAFGASTVTLYLWPKPDAIYTVNYDGIARGTEMSADGDIPVIPEDFHDILELGATADELMKMEKEAQADKMELRREGRTRELRYFIAKTAWLTQGQGDIDAWWFGPWYSYRGFD